MNAIFIIGSVQAFFFSVLIFTKTQKKLHDKILGLWLFFMGLQLLMKYIIFNELYVYIPWILGFNGGLPLVHGPFLFLYINALTENYNKLRSIDLLHLLPFIIFYTYLSPVLFLSPEDKIQIFIHGGSFDMKYLPLFLMILISGPIYIIWSFFSLKKHQENILKFFSFNERVGLKWLYYLTLGLMVIWVAIFMSYLFEQVFRIINSTERDFIIYIVFVIYVFVVGFKGFKQGSIFFNLHLLSINQDKSSKPKEKSQIKNSDETLIRIQDYMETEKPFLEEKLSIVQLSESLDIPYYILSQIINEKLNQNFFDFVNTYRVNEAKEKLIDPKFDHYTILGIAMECGFNSKASFNRIFKLKTSETPTQFRNSQKE